MMFKQRHEESDVVVCDTETMKVSDAFYTHNQVHMESRLSLHSWIIPISNSLFDVRDALYTISLSKRLSRGDSFIFVVFDPGVYGAIIALSTSVVTWVSGMCTNLSKSEAQFVYARAESDSGMKSSLAKNQAVKQVRVVPPFSYDIFETLVKEASEKMGEQRKVASIKKVKYLHFLGDLNSTIQVGKDTIFSLVSIVLTTDPYIVGTFDDGDRYLEDVYDRCINLNAPTSKNKEFSSWFHPVSCGSFETFETFNSAESELVQLLQKLCSSYILWSCVNYQGSFAVYTFGSPFPYTFIDVLSDFLLTSIVLDPQFITKTLNPCLAPIRREKVGSSEKRCTDSASNQFSRNNDALEKDYERVKTCTYFLHPNCIRGNNSKKLLSFPCLGPFLLVPQSGSTTALVSQPSSNTMFKLLVTYDAVVRACVRRTWTITFQLRYVISDACSKKLYYKQKEDNVLYHLCVRQHSQLHWTTTTSDWRLKPLKATFSQVVKKEMLLDPVRLQQFQNHSSQMDASNLIDNFEQFSVWCELISAWSYSTKLILVFGMTIKRCHHNQKWLPLPDRFSYLLGNVPNWLPPMSFFCPPYKHKLKSLENGKFFEQEKLCSLKDLKYLIVILGQALWQLLGVISSDCFGCENRTSTLLFILRHQLILEVKDSF